MNEHLTLIQVLRAQEATLLRDAMATVSLDDGQILFERGDPGDALYIIETGQMRIFTLDEEQKELTLNTLGPGEAFGELALLDGLPRSASAAAVGPTTLHCLRREDFRRALRTSPSLTDTVVRLLSQRVRDLIDYIERLGHWTRLVAIGQYDQALASYRDALERRPSAGTQVAEMRRKIAKTWELQGRYEEAAHNLDLARDALEGGQAPRLGSGQAPRLGSGQATVELARVYGDMGWVAMRQGTTRGRFRP